jgi:hypothetical protein
MFPAVASVNPQSHYGRQNYGSTWELYSPRTAHSLNIYDIQLLNIVEASPNINHFVSKTTYFEYGWG